MKAPYLSLVERGSAGRGSHKEQEVDWSERLKGAARKNFICLSKEPIVAVPFQGRANPNTY